jgi:hypothetical protein
VAQAEHWAEQQEALEHLAVAVVAQVALALVEQVDWADYLAVAVVDAQLQIRLELEGREDSVAGAGEDLTPQASQVHQAVKVFLLAVPGLSMGLEELAVAVAVRLP